MMKRFKLVDMREQYQDLILEAESSSMDYETFLVRLLAAEEEGKIRRRTEKLRREAGFESETRWRTLIMALTSHWIKTRSWNWAGWIFLMPVKMSS